ncbi:hypothetical protein, partial [uncultured Sphingobacterium sp.]|uniref:hypothetical protein n=1 Tax=uncultured Sphingobacterium sp. TaxID=182688 RepID=UPI0037485E24
RSTGPSVSPVHRKLFRNRRYPAACIDRIKSYYFLAVSYSCISFGLAVATCNKQLYMLFDCWEVCR